MKILPRNPEDSQIKKAYNRVIWFYDAWSRWTEQKAMETGIKWADIRDGESIIDIGCGTGRLLDQTIPLNPHGSNVGIDLSSDMLTEAQKRLKQQAGDFTLQEADVLDWPVESQSFDLIFNYYMVDMMPEEKFDQIAGKYFQMIRPGGRIVIGSFSMGSGTIHRFWFWLARNFPALLTYCRPITFAPYLEKAGFKITKKEQIIQNTFPSEVILAVKG